MKDPDYVVMAALLTVGTSYKNFDTTSMDSKERVETAKENYGGYGNYRGKRKGQYTNMRGKPYQVKGKGRGYS
eukprot:5917851-Amphidinium_carterae.1